MNDIVMLRDPTPEQASACRGRKAAPADLTGRTVALMDIGKMRGRRGITRYLPGSTPPSR